LNKAAVIKTDLWAEAVALGRQVIWLHAFGEAFPGPVLQFGFVT
jgi:hypothetical protein